METRFILPAAFATALHLLVLFSAKGTSDNMSIAQTPTAQPQQPRMVVNLNDPPVPPPEAETGAAEAKGNPEQFLPRLEEPPSQLSSPYDLTMARINPRPDVAVDRIIPGPVGVLDGIGTRNMTIINSRFLDNPPRTHSQVAPIYPAEARSAGVTAEVTVEFIVDESGRVQTARIVQSTDSRFESATLRAVQKWRFAPGKKNGRAVRFRMVAPVVFSLET